MRNKVNYKQWKETQSCESYLKVPLESRDILTAHLHVIQSHLR